MSHHCREYRFHPRPLCQSGHFGLRGAMTLLELLIAMSIMVMVVGTLGALARGVQQGFRYTEGHGAMTQHARVALDRITRTVREATANERFPGVLVVVDTVQDWRFPDTLAVWHPDEQTLQDHPGRLPLSDPARKPYYDELAIYCPHPLHPEQLVEITDDRNIALDDDEANWAGEIEAIKTLRTAPASKSAPPVTLTKLLRTSSVLGFYGNALPARGAVRFETLLRPSEDDWDDYQAIVDSDPTEEDAAWKGLPWVQGIYGSRTGLRQVWLRIELQLIPGGERAASDTAADQTVAFLDSAAVYYELHREKP